MRNDFIITPYYYIYFTQCQITHGEKQMLASGSPYSSVIAFTMAAGEKVPMSVTMKLTSSGFSTSNLGEALATRKAGVSLYCGETIMTGRAPR